MLKVKKNSEKTGDIDGAEVQTNSYVDVTRTQKPTASLMSKEQIDSSDAKSTDIPLIVVKTMIHSGKSENQLKKWTYG